MDKLDFLARELKQSMGENQNIIAVIPTEEKIFVLVKDKKQLLDSFIKNYTDNDKIIYVESPPFEFYQYPTQRARPFSGGYSIGHYKVSAGTASLKVKNLRNNKPAVLSNNHVLANINTGKEGDAIYQPGTADGGSSRDLVARLDHFVPIRNGATVDCAVANLTDPSYMTDDILKIGNIYGLCDAYINQPIYKYGRTSKLTRGNIISTDASIQVGVGTQVFRFDDIIISDIVSAPGDSGSSILDFNNNYLVGLLFAGNGQITAICKSKNVFEQLGIELYPQETIKKSLWLDISKWQGSIDFAKMKSRNVEGVIIKACQGVNYIDPNFETNYTNAKNNGLKVGAYIYLDFQYNAYEHFSNLKNILRDKNLDIPIALDCEDQTGKKPDEVSNIILGLSNLIFQEYGKRPIIYTNQSWWNSNTVSMSIWNEHPLWIANWSKSFFSPLMPRDWSKWVMWQHQVNKNGAWFGVSSTDIDMNTTNEYFRELLGETPPPEPPPPEPPPAPPEEKTPFITYKGKTLVNLNYRSSPSVSGTRLGVMPINTIINILNEIPQPNGDIWLEIGYKQYCARLYNGNKYVEYI